MSKENREDSFIFSDNFKRLVALCFLLGTMLILFYGVGRKMGFWAGRRNPPESAIEQRSTRRTCDFLEDRAYCEDGTDWLVQPVPTETPLPQQ